MNPVVFPLCWVHGKRKKNKNKELDNFQARGKNTMQNQE